MARMLNTKRVNPTERERNKLRSDGSAQYVSPITRKLKPQQAAKREQPTQYCEGMERTVDAKVAITVRLPIGRHYQEMLADNGKPLLREGQRAPFAKGQRSDSTQGPEASKGRWLSWPETGSIRGFWRLCRTRVISQECCPDTKAAWIDRFPETAQDIRRRWKAC